MSLSPWQFSVFFIWRNFQLFSQAVEDRTFCMTNAPTTCANSCAGVVTQLGRTLLLSTSSSPIFLKSAYYALFFLPQPCTQTCTVVCGFWYFYRRICSNVSEFQLANNSHVLFQRWPPQPAQPQLWQQQQRQQLQQQQHRRKWTSVNTQFPCSLTNVMKVASTTVATTTAPAIWMKL